MMCTYEKDGAEKEVLLGIQNSLKELDYKLYQIERNQFDPQPLEPRRSTIARVTGKYFMCDLFKDRNSLSTDIFPNFSLVIFWINAE